MTDSFDADDTGVRPRTPEPASAALKSLEEELAQTRERANRLAQAYRALEAEQEAFRQRLEREHARTLEVDRGVAFSIVIEALDELDRALGAGPPDDPLTRGVQMVRDGMLRRLAEAGVERLTLVGTPFDPHLAEAVETVWTPEPQQDGRVVEELRPAYARQERVIRPARVKVGRHTPPAVA
ncbi:MAG TPA: nucleotide exchange factor GrpE [Myxococcaceae bacterium]|nr:nucleotide exchange factor GrpE [Myxococcaceae bacterium]